MTQNYINLRDKEIRKRRPVGRLINGVNSYLLTLAKFTYSQVKQYR